MKKSRTFYKNLVLGTEFDKYLVEHPKFAEQIPNDSIVVLLPQDDPQLCQENLHIAKTRTAKGQSIIYIKIKKLAPAPKSRLVKPQIELAKAG